MTPAEVLKDAFERVVDDAEQILDGLTQEQLTTRVSPDANTIAWLIWHSARVQDASVGDLAGTEQVWTSRGFADRFDLSLDVADTGYGHTSEQVAAVRAPADLLLEYLEAAHKATIGYLDGVTDADLDRVVDTHWDPPVTLGVRLVSVVNDQTQHIGQAAYVRGLLPRAV